MEHKWLVCIIIRNQSTSCLDNVGNRIQHIAKVIGIAESLHDVGKTIYTADRVVAPLAGALL